MPVINSVLLHLAALPTPLATHPSAVMPSPTVPTGGSSGGISGLESAVIGVIGSVVGGAVGGWFALRAAALQSRRERLEARLDRSRQAAMIIADAWPILEEVLLARAADEASVSQLDQAFNAFARTATTQSIPICDADVRQRIRNHVDLVFPLTNHSVTPGTLAGRVEKLRRHGEAVRTTIAAHYNDEALPAYTAPRQAPGVG